MLIFVKDARNSIVASSYLNDEAEPEPAQIIAEARRLAARAYPRGKFVEIEKGGRPTYFASVSSVVLAALGCLEPERALTRDRARVDAYRYGLARA